jgi:hypothetical protein
MQLQLNTYLFFQSIAATVKDTNVDGVEGLNIQWAAPFKFDDYVVGFRYALGNMRKSPQSLFAKRTYETPVIEGAATIDMDYVLDSKVLSVESKFVSKKGTFMLKFYLLKFKMLNFTFSRLFVIFLVFHIDSFSISYDIVSSFYI